MTRRRFAGASSWPSRWPSGRLDPVAHRELLTFVIIGGGPTGVELAGALAEISRHSLRGDFQNIDPSEARILLMEGLDRILPVYSPDLSEKARRSLEKLGVEVRTGTRVTNIDDDGRLHRRGAHLRRARCCGPRAWRPRRWPARWGWSWTAPAARRCRPS